MIQLLETEKKVLEGSVKNDDLMYKNMNKATLYLKNINELKRAIKVLKAKTRIAG